VGVAEAEVDHTTTGLAMVNITGLDKAEVLQALHHASRAQGMGILHDRGPLDLSECHAEIEACKENPYSRGKLYFDYLRGRVMKVDLTGDEFDPRLYDRDVGQGAAERAVSRLRAGEV
jgi:hypothetical protein